MIREAILKLLNKENLSGEMTGIVMDEIMNGEATQVQISAFLTALTLKGESIDEITASASIMRKHCTKLISNEDLMEIVGTGGDKSNSFNISTISSIVVSAAGVPIAKHGNRASTSKCGAADVLEALGVNINIPVEKSEEILKEINMCFLFAQKYHSSMKFVAPIRKELGIRTIFNILGPLSNPAGANKQLMGVYDESLVEPLAVVLSNLGVKRAMVVFGLDGLDEISVSSSTKVCEVNEGELNSYIITPEEFGIKRCNKSDLVGGTPKENAEIAINILNGERGSKRDAVVINSAAALYIAGRVESLREGIALAENTIDIKKAKQQLDNFIALSNQLEAKI